MPEDPPVPLQRGGDDEVPSRDAQNKGSRHSRQPDSKPRPRRRDSALPAALPAVEGAVRLAFAERVVLEESFRRSAHAAALAVCCFLMGGFNLFFALSIWSVRIAQPMRAISDSRVPILAAIFVAALALLGVASLVVGFRLPLRNDGTGEKAPRDPLKLAIRRRVIVLSISLAANVVVATSLVLLSDKSS